jgi:DNA (cytosine-5)-methyltransferase 1
VVTPLVSNIAVTLFKHTLRVAGQLEHDDIEDDASSDLDEIMHHDDPEVIEWLDPAEVDGYYESVDMDGMIYSVSYFVFFNPSILARSHPAKVGDVVMVMPGSDVDRRRSANAIAKTSRSKNTLGNTAWFVRLLARPFVLRPLDYQKIRFCRICYMYDSGDGEKVFHGQWYTHGSKTLLQETANPQSLFLMDSCEPDLPLASIIQKCNMRELAIGEDEPTDESNANENRFYHG